MKENKKTLSTKPFLTFDPDCMVHTPNGSRSILSLMGDPRLITDALQEFSGNDQKKIKTFVNLVGRMNLDKIDCFYCSDINFCSAPQDVFYYTLFESLYYFSLFRTESEKVISDVSFDSFVLSDSFTEKYLTPNSLKIISVCIAILEKEESVLGMFSRRKCADLEEKARPVRKIITKLKVKSVKISLAIKSVFDIKFWRGEYIKRNFALRLKKDLEIRNKSRSAFFYFCNAIKRIQDDGMCEDCVFQLGDKYLDGRCIKRCIGCKPMLCSAAIGAMQQIDKCNYIKTGRRGSFGFYSEKKPVPPTLGCSEAAELTLEFGLYPTDLFSCVTAKQLLDHKEKYGYLPRPYFYAPFSSITIDDGDFRAADFFADGFESERDSHGIERFHDKFEERIVGLWLWDKVNFGKPNSSIRSLLVELRDLDWYLGLEIARIDKHYLKDIETATQADCKYIVERYRRLSDLTGKCIMERKILPISSAAGGKNTKADECTSSL